MPSTTLSTMPGYFSRMRRMKGMPTAQTVVAASPTDTMPCTVPGSWRAIDRA